MTGEILEKLQEITQIKTGLQKWRDTRRKYC